MENLKTVFFSTYYCEYDAPIMIICKKITYDYSCALTILHENETDAEYAIPVTIDFHTQIMQAMFNSNSVWINAIGTKLIDTSKCSNPYSARQDNDNMIYGARKRNKNLTLSVIGGGLNSV